jgi:hypothetical protein
VAVWSLQCTDAGFDGSDATITGLTITRGPGNQIPDWTTAIGGAQLRDAALALDIATVTSDTLVFSGFTFVVQEGSSDTLTIHLWLSSADDALDGLDNAHLELALVPGDLTVSPAGSTIAAGQTTVTTGGSQLALEVAAALLSYTVQPLTPVGRNQNMAPIVLEATDANHNLDADFAEPTTLSPVGVAGSLASTDPGGLTHASAGGTVGWADLSCDTAGTLTVRATTTPTGLTADASPVTVLAVPAITQVLPDRGPAEGGTHVQIQGTAFAAGMGVTIGGDPATDVLVLDSTLLTCRVPPAAGGEASTWVDVTVDLATASGAYLYLDDTVGPALVATHPESFTDGFSDTQRLAYTFDAALDPASVQDPTASVTASTALAQSVWLGGQAYLSEDRHALVLRRSGTWTSGGGQIQGFVFGEHVGSNALEDVHGNGLQTTWGTVGGRGADAFFSANPPTLVPDGTAPTIARTVPVAGATGTPRGAPVEISFSEAIDATTIRQVAGGPVTAMTFEVRDAGTLAQVPGRLVFNHDLRTVWFQPDAGLDPGTTYQVRFLDGGGGARVEDLAGNGLAATTFSFTTTSTTGLAVTACDPATGEITGGISVRVLGEHFAPGATVTFDGEPATGVLRTSASELEVVAPPGAAPGAVDVTVTNPGGVAGTGVGVFTYAATMPQDLQPLEILFEYPPAVWQGTNPCPASSRVVIVFSEPPSTATEAFSVGSTQAIQVNGGPPAATAVRLTTDPRVVVLTPASPFSTTPRVHLVPRRAANPDIGMRDLAGNRLLHRHPDTRYTSVSGDPSAGFEWTLAGADATPPGYVSRRPAPGSTGNAPTTAIRLTLDEEVDPASVESGFAVSDGLGAVPGTLTFDVATLRAWTFEPTRLLSGTVTVSATLVTDLSGNAVGGGSYAFSITGDNQAPIIDDLTLCGIPDYLNGDAAYGGGSAIGGRLRVPPTGFTIDLTYHDLGGTVDTDRAAFVLTSSTAVGGYPAGTNLAPLIPDGYFQADASTAHVLVPPNLPFPAGTDGGSAQSSRVTCQVRDQAGNLSSTVWFEFDCVAALGPWTALEDPADVWYLETFRDHDTTTYDLLDYNVTAPGAEGCPGGDGVVDLDRDLEGYGVLSYAPFSPNGTGLVNSGTLSMNQAARTWLVNRMLYHCYRIYGLSVAWADGNPNPGFLAIRVFEPDGSLEAANVRFLHAASSPGVSTNRMALGGYRDTTTLGRANYDSRNTRRAHDNGETCFATNLGIFTQLRIAAEHQGLLPGGPGPSSAGSPYRTTLDAITPFTGAVTPNPIGNDPEDPYILDPAQDPMAFTGSRRTRYEEVLQALDGLARSTVATIAHEIGHSLGLIENGDPGSGLYGNDTAAFPGSTSAHLDLDSFYPGNGSNLMSPGSSMDEDLSRYSVINELAQGYLQNRILVAP